MTDDFISRQAAIDALQKEINKGIPPFDDVMGSIRCGVRLARNIIEDLPSAQPTAEPVRHGKWTVTPIYIKCSECGESFMLIPQNYCPNCGADMRGEQDDSI